MRRLCAGLRGDAGRGHPDALPTRLIVAVDAFGFADADVTPPLKPMVNPARRPAG